MKHINIERKALLITIISSLFAMTSLSACDPKDEEEDPSSDIVCEAGSGTIVTVSQSPDEHETGFMNDDTEGLCEKHYGFTQSNEAFNTYFKEKYGKDFSYKSVKSCKDHENIAHVVFCPISIDGHLDKDDFYKLTGCDLWTGANCTMEQDLFSEFHVCHCSDSEQLYCGKDNKNPCLECNCETKENCSEYDLERYCKCDCVHTDRCSEEELKACPPQHQICPSTDGYHVYNDVCEADSIDNCGAHGKKCTVEHGTPACVNKECVVDHCDDGYELNYEKCVEKGALICNPPYHINGNTCELDDAENCGEHGKKCPGIENGTAVCTRGECDLLCNAGYHFYASENGDECEADSVRQCGSHDWACGNYLQNAIDYVCEQGTCIAKLCESGYHLNDAGKCLKDEISCDKDYHLYNNGCEMDDELNCGEHGVECHDDHGFSVCWERRCMSTTCNEGYHSPVYEDILYHYYSPSSFAEMCQNCEVGKHWDTKLKACVADDFRNCGAQHRDCYYLGISKGTCEQGKCVAAECLPKYVLQNDGTCKACPYDMHAYNGECVKNDIQNCGSHGNNCQINNTNHIKKKECLVMPEDSVNSAVCNITECDSSYYPSVNYYLNDKPISLDSCEKCDEDYRYIENGICLRANTVENCGKKGNDCKKLHPELTQLTCTRGDPVYDYFFVCNTTCPDGEFIDFNTETGKFSCVAKCPSIKSSFVDMSGNNVCYYGSCHNDSDCQFREIDHGHVVCREANRIEYYASTHKLCNTIVCDEGYVLDGYACVKK